MSNVVAFLIGLVIGAVVGLLGVALVSVNNIKE